MDVAATLAFGIPALVALMVAASLFHASIAARRLPPAQALSRPRVVLVSLLHLLCAGGVYRYLIIGGWLTNHYHWDDPNDINLVLAVFEALCAVAVLALAICRKPFLYKLLIDLLIIQIIISSCLLILLLLFILTWHPRMM